MRLAYVHTFAHIASIPYDCGKRLLAGMRYLVPAVIGVNDFRFGALTDEVPSQSGALAAAAMVRSPYKR